MRSFRSSGSMNSRPILVITLTMLNAPSFNVLLWFQRQNETHKQVSIEKSSLQGPVAFLCCFFLLRGFPVGCGCCIHCVRCSHCHPAPVHCLPQLPVNNPFVVVPYQPSSFMKHHIAAVDRVGKNGANSPWCKLIPSYHKRDGAGQTSQVCMHYLVRSPCPIDPGGTYTSLPDGCALLPAT